MLKRTPFHWGEIFRQVAYPKHLHNNLAWVAVLDSLGVYFDETDQPHLDGQLKTIQPKLEIDINPKYTDDTQMEVLVMLYLYSAYFTNHFVNDQQHHPHPFNDFVVDIIHPERITPTQYHQFNPQPDYELDYYRYQTATKQTLDFMMGALLPNYLWQPFVDQNFSDGLMCTEFDLPQFIITQRRQRQFK